MKTLGFLLLLIYIHAAISSQVCVVNHISSNSFFIVFAGVFLFRTIIAIVQYAILLTITSNTLTLLYVIE